MSVTRIVAAREWQRGEKERKAMKLKRKTYGRPPALAGIPAAKIDDALEPRARTSIMGCDTRRCDHEGLTLSPLKVRMPYTWPPATDPVATFVAAITISPGRHRQAQGRSDFWRRDVVELRIV